MPTSVESPYSWRGPARFLARSSMLVNAAICFVVGFSLLVAPAYIPLTVGMWLVAAAMIGLAILTPFDAESARSG